MRWGRAAHYRLTHDRLVDEPASDGVVSGVVGGGVVDEPAAVAAAVAVVGEVVPAM